MSKYEFRKHHYRMEDFVQKVVKEALINYCKKQTWITYDGENFHIHDENIKQKIHKSIFSNARETLDVIKIYLKQNCAYSEEDLSGDFSEDSFLGEIL
jgi:hypothetical protein